MSDTSARWAAVLTLKGILHVDWSLEQWLAPAMTIFMLPFGLKEWGPPLFAAAQVIYLLLAGLIWMSSTSSTRPLWIPLLFALPIMCIYAAFIVPDVWTLAALIVVTGVLASSGGRFGSIPLFAYFVSAIILFGFRQNSLVLLPLVVFRIMKRTADSRRERCALLSMTAFAILLIVTVPHYAGFGSRTSSAAAPAWELVGMLRMADELHAPVDPRITLDGIADTSSAIQAHSFITIDSLLWGEGAPLSSAAILTHSSELKSRWFRAVREYPNLYFLMKMRIYKCMLGFCDQYIHTQVAPEPPFPFLEGHVGGYAENGGLGDTILKANALAAQRFEFAYLPVFWLPLGWLIFLIQWSRYSTFDRQLICGATLYAFSFFLLNQAASFRYMYPAYAVYTAYQFRFAGWAFCSMTGHLKSRVAGLKQRLRPRGFAGAGNRDWAAMAMVVALVFLTYAVTLTSTYGMRDDYYFLRNGIDGNRGTIELLTGAGRPLNGWLLHLGFSAAGSIGHMASLRFVTLVGIALLGCVLYAFSRMHRLTLATSLSLAAATVLLPSFQVYAAWTQHFTTPFAGISGLVAAYLVSPARPGNERVSAGTIISATLLLAAAMLVYQPTAMFFFTGILISVFASPRPRRDWSLARIVSSAGVFGTAMAIGFAALKVGQQWYPGGGARYGLLSDPLGKARWFFDEPLRNALSLYIVPGSAPFAIGCAAVVLGGLGCYFMRQPWRSGAYAVLLGLLCLLGACVPNLATGENWASYRSTGALAASVVVLLALLVIEPLARYRSRMQAARQQAAATAGAFLGAALLLCLAVTVQGNVANGLVLPNVAELDNLTGAMTRSDIGNVRQILVHPSAWADSAARPTAYDEFGFPSSVSNYYAGAMVDLVRTGLHILDDAGIAVVEKGDVVPRPAGPGQILDVDFARLTTSGRAKVVPAAVPPPTTIVLENVNDDNWTSGIWTNRQRPNAYSFVYRRGRNGVNLKPGDRVGFARSGVRTVVKVDSFGNYLNVLVDGPPLERERAYTAVVVVARQADVRQ